MTDKQKEEAQKNCDYLTEIIGNVGKVLSVENKPANYRLELEVIAKVTKLQGQLLELRNWINGD